MRCSTGQSALPRNCLTKNASIENQAAGRIPGHAAAQRDAEPRRNSFANHNCRDMRFAQSLLKPWGGSVRVSCNSSVKPPTQIDLPRPGHQHVAWFANISASCPYCSAVTCLACPQLRQASTPSARVPAGSGVAPQPSRKFRTSAYWKYPLVVTKHIHICTNAPDLI
jgi:hypothetical protein